MVETFEARVGSRVRIQPDGCWYYGTGDPNTYGMISWNGGGGIAAHRWFYSMLVGKLLPGEVIHHKCQVPRCVNPDHLEALTPSEHMQLHAELRRQSAA